ncbi:GDSL esterase/lipase At5g14450 isoform X2 [Sesamum indicum]|uniref:GDSL esterase/lipase At5g14450 isoform X2 n=1 Tax=Sesamum indicum TaxID=4182 RepID=A0A6I9U8U8_SESIN|nr:GDSL esterase/lipase At5g14450 isoform X2 [Sesamum indicum]
MGFLINLVLWFFFSSPTIRTNGDDEVINLPPCDYSTMYNFGDSNSDTGGIAAAFYPPASPSGETYYGRPVGRASDGRLIIDFIVGSSYQNGANFATGGATILRPNGSWFDSGLSPFNLEIQVEHFTQFKDRTAYLYGQAQDECTRKRLPRPENFSEALFTLDIGQNDVAVGIRSLSYELQQAVVPNILSQFITQVRGLYERGARTFWVHNTGPIGCLPVAIAKVKDPAPGYLDENGCVKSQNDIALQFNEELKDEIVKLRAELSDAAIVYVDMYAAKYELITNAKNQGFEDPFEICCGYHGIGYDVWCGNKGNVNGTEVYAGSCEDPSKIISWDGVHYTEAANHWIANRIVNGSMSDPSIPITSACHARANLSALGFF